MYDLIFHVAVYYSYRRDSRDEEELEMAKAKKEFKNRVRKMQKHVAALIEIAPAGPHFDRLYALQGHLDELQKDHNEIFREEDPEPLVSQHERKGADSRGIAN